MEFLNINICFDRLGFLDFSNININCLEFSNIKISYVLSKSDDRIKKILKLTMFGKTNPWCKTKIESILSITTDVA